MKFKKLYGAMLVAMASTYSVPSVSETFAVSEPMETKLNDAIKESADFLNQITVMPVTDGEGQALEIGVSGLLAKRTNTDNKDRTPTILGGPTGSTYKVKLTEYDVALPYSTLDAWARYKDFQDRYRQAVLNAIALNRLMVGFNGTSAAVETDPVANPLGQDVNIGWLKILKDQNPANYLDDSSSAAAGTVSINPANAQGNGHKSLDGLVADLYNAIPVQYRTGKEVAIIGSDLAAADANKVFDDNGGTPSEKEKAKAVLQTYGGLQAIQVPGFPPMGVMVTDPANLHLYYQEGKTRRQLEDEPKRNRTVDYISTNDAYAIGNLKAIAAVDPSKVTLAANA